MSDNPPGTRTSVLGTNLGIKVLHFGILAVRNLLARLQPGPDERLDTGSGLDRVDEDLAVRDLLFRAVLPVVVVVSVSVEESAWVSHQKFVTPW